MRILERVLDRQLHVGRAQLGDHRAVDEFDQRMDDRLRMDTTSICSGRRSNSQRASMISSALFIIVAESIVIFGPMSQVGMGEGVGDRHLRQLLERAVRETVRRWR